MTAPLSSLLPDFPWDTIADARARATAHPGGLCDQIGRASCRERV